ncbi:MAG: malate/lactate/ureidoglycolate dehydrogenase [Planctomycetota bacterium]
MQIASTKLKRLVEMIFHAAGCRPLEDERIAHYLVEANLVGHDSHGVIRIPYYVRMLQDGKVIANRSVEVLFETESLLVLDGNYGFGQVIGEQSMKLAIAKAEKTGVCILALRHCAHLGRIGDLPLIATSAGMISIHFVNTSGIGVLVAPHGGIDRRLSANPIAVGIPVAGEPPIILDISTCSIAEGKIRVAFNKGEKVPAGSIIDADGKPTDDPRIFYADPPGAILPLGGHKGYGLGLITDILAGALTGSGCTDPSSATRLLNGMLAIVLDPRKFPTEYPFGEEVRRFVQFVRSSRPVANGGEILMPGEVEERTKAKRQREGIPIDENTWSQVTDVARSLGIPEEEIRAAAS